MRVCVEAVKHILASGSCHDNEMRNLKAVLFHLDECTSGDTLGLPPTVVGQVLLSVCKVGGEHETVGCGGPVPSAAAAGD